MTVAVLKRESGVIACHSEKVRTQARVLRNSRAGRVEKDVVMNSCKSCGCTESQAIADAKKLGLQQEFQNGIYTCCQIAQWAQEQWSAWTQATEEDTSYRYDGSVSAELGNEEAVLVPVCCRRAVAWFRSA
jgi:hypothetical protein